MIFRQLVRKYHQMDHIANLKQIFLKSVEAVKPEKLLNCNVQRKENVLTIGTNNFELKKPVHVVGFGKAVYGMAIELERILGNQLERGILNIPTGFFENRQMSALCPKWRIFQGAKDNLPDLDAMQGAKEIASLCESLQKDDVLIVLISGGGSALLPLPRAGITLQEKQDLVKKLFNRGANINEVNCIRKRVSELKGGQLAMKAFPATVISLILSDIIGDPVDFIASGPTVKNADAPELPFNILKKYHLMDEISSNISKAIGEPLAIDDFPDVLNLIIGNNHIACKAAKVVAENLGYESVVLSTEVQGDLDEIAMNYAKLAKDVLNGCKVPFETSGKGKPLCIVAGGEPSIHVKNPQGSGGRNQHLALKLTSLMEGKPFYFLSAGTDGIDGPTDVAGAIGTSTLDLCHIRKHLSEFSSYDFYRNHPDLWIKTGHSGTNVMDIHLLVLETSVTI